MTSEAAPLVPYEAVSFPIGGKAVYYGLITKYSLLAVYSACTVYFGAVTVGQATSPMYARVFPVALFFSCLAALYGVIRSRYTRKVWLEYLGTVLLIAGMFGYSVALAYTGVTDNMLYRLPAALLPVILSVFPILRLINILRVVRRRAAEKGATA